MESNIASVSEQVAPLATTTAARPAALSWPKRLLRDCFDTVLPALLVALFIVTFVVQPTRVDGISMEPTLHSEQRLVVEKVSYRLHDPARGDVVVLKLPGREQTPLIKRVIATGGDVVAIRNGQVFLNGAPLEENYLAQWTPGELPSMVVPEGYLFVLGDNRGASNDSRAFGMAPQDHIVGRAFVSYWPLSTVGLVR